MANFRSILGSFSSLHLAGRCPPIFLFSNARSGSTWLAEMIATQPGIRLVDEPLHPERHNYRGAIIPPTWEFLLPNPKRELLISEYFGKMIRGKIRVGGPGFLTRNYKVLTWQVLFKVLRCHDLMNWFESQFGAKIIYLIRHPIAVSISRKEIPRLPLFVSNSEYVNKYLDNKQHQLARKIVEEGTSLEQRVLDWVLQNVPPINFLDQKNWICIHYEDIVLRPHEVLSVVGDKLALPAPDRMLKQSNIASSSVRISDSATQKRFKDGTVDTAFLLGKWRERITIDDEKRVFDILEQFGITQYGVGQDEPIRRL